jgi:flagellar basal body-associated protein FliL
MSTTDIIALWTLIVTVIGLVLALVGIAVAIRTLKESAKVAKRQFFVTVRALLANYDDIHANLRPGGT